MQKSAQKRALITGATSGIGKEMAIYLHSLGWQLTLTGRNEEALQRMAALFGEGTKYIALDLAKRGAAERLYTFCRGDRIDLLINNAGFGVFGTFTETSLSEELELIEVNIRSLHILTKLFLRDFERRDSGCILNVASCAGFMTGPMLSSYYASKNYVVRLTLAIREELRRRYSRVKVSVLCPGPVDTNFNNRAGVTFSVKPASPRYVARYAIDRALAGRAIIIPTLGVQLSVLGAKLLPDAVSRAVVYELQKRKQRT
ncbi:MAG: SDR family NAD(P)-dependent oxidoreductase [Oscillospiraceae bacterium]|nr:SDR family NAD(P)-dependent oxidoreductase [Oscillospiraceae bacterium]